jgi:hypothetical protein
MRWAGNYFGRKMRYFGRKKIFRQEEGRKRESQHLRRGAMDRFMLFAGAPIDQSRTRSFFAVGVRDTGAPAASKLLGEDETRLPARQPDVEGIARRPARRRKSVFQVSI